MLGGCLYPGLFVCLTHPENLQGWFLEDGTNKPDFYIRLGLEDLPTFCRSH